MIIRFLIPFFTHDLSAWKEEQERKDSNAESLNPLLASIDDDRTFVGIDLTQFMSSNSFDIVGEESKGRRLQSSSEREVVKRYIEKAYESTKVDNETSGDVTHLLDDDGVEFDIERALSNSSAQDYLLSVLSQRCKIYAYASFDCEIG